MVQGERLNHQSRGVYEVEAPTASQGSQQHCTDHHHHHPPPRAPHLCDSGWDEALCRATSTTGPSKVSAAMPWCSQLPEQRPLTQTLGGTIFLALPTLQHGKSCVSEEQPLPGLFEAAY